MCRYDLASSQVSFDVAMSSEAASLEVEPPSNTLATEARPSPAGDAPSSLALEDMALLAHARTMPPMDARVALFRSVLAPATHHSRPAAMARLRALMAALTGRTTTVYDVATLRALDPTVVPGQAAKSGRRKRGAVKAASVGAAATSCAVAPASEAIRPPATASMEFSSTPPPTKLNAARAWAGP